MARPTTLVCLSLRGGADGLSLVPPHGDPHYRALRPTLGLARPDDATAPLSSRALELDGFFGLHPALGPLAPLFREGLLAVVHAVGSDDGTRSHFEAQDTMDHGASSLSPLASGWLARMLAGQPGGASPLRAVAVGERLPESLRGTPAVVVRTGEELSAMGALPEGTLRALAALYAGCGHEGLAQAARSAVGALKRLGGLGRGEGAPSDTLGGALGQVARLIRGDVGLRVACVEHGGWDTHFTQGQLFPGLAGELASGLAGFAAALGPRLDEVLVVVLTEFGRRAAENVTLGTDHGRASVLLLLGGAVRGGRVYGDWPGLAEGQLEGPGDVRVTTDYRQVLGELVAAFGARPKDVFGASAPLALAPGVLRSGALAD